MKILGFEHWTGNIVCIIGIKNLPREDIDKISKCWFIYCVKTMLNAIRHEKVSTSTDTFLEASLATEIHFSSVMSLKWLKIHFKLASCEPSRIAI